MRVPVLRAHSEAVNIEFHKPISVNEARQALEDSDGVIIIDRIDSPSGYVTPIETSAKDAVFVSRIRKDTTIKHGLSMWVVADNLRKGAALNAVQIAELLVKDYGL